MAEELETILRLVADGALTPEQAEPIIAALTQANEAGGELGRARRRVDDALARAEQRIEQVTGRRGRRLRIRVTERGRQVVNLQIPVGLVESALQFIPGLGGDQRESVRDAVRAGATGAILDVEDEDGGGVLITVE